MVDKWEKCKNYMDARVNCTYAKAVGACQALMLMLNIIQKRLTDDWLIDWSLPFRLFLTNNEEGVDCESKTLHNCCSIIGVPSGLSQNDA